VCQGNALPLSYNGEQSIHIDNKESLGAGDGNRTHATSLGSWSSAIELHPHLERKTGFEPATLALARRCSTTEPLPRALNGGSGRNRTADTRIFSPLLYRLSYRAIWLRGQDSNLRPSGYEPDELPTAPPRVVELRNKILIVQASGCYIKSLKLVGVDGLEPPTLCL
jgi:hypothetical protein